MNGTSGRGATGPVPRRLAGMAVPPPGPVPPGEFDVAALVEALTAAPSLHNTQPWRVRRIDRGLQLRANLRRWLPATDVGGRELRLSCGAGLLNMRLALAAAGFRPVVELLPAGTDPAVLATIRPGERVRPTREETALAAAIPRRHSDRGAFRPEAVTVAHRLQLRRAAEREGAWLHGVSDPDEQARLRELMERAHRVQLADPGFARDWKTWTGREDGELVGVPRRSGGTPPEGNDDWMLRDFTHGARPPAAEDPAGFDPAPLLLVIATHRDLPVAHLRAGQALQRVLLTATALGLSSSILSALVEVAGTRTDLGRLIGPGVHPQILVRVGHGSGTPLPAPRSAVSTLWA